MTYEEAIQLLGESKKYWARIHPIYKAHDVAIEALEKQIPKKVIIWKFGGDGLPYPYCSLCGNPVIRSGYCDKCGQKLEF